MTAIVVILSTVLVAGACVPSPVRATLPVAPAAVVVVEPDAVAARVSGARVEVLVAPSGGAAVRVLASSDAHRGATSVNLVTYGGESGTDWNSFVYGTALPGAVRVDLDWPGSVGGAVVDGAWVVVLPDKDVTPPDLTWRFLAADGTELASGEGIIGPGH